MRAIMATLVAGIVITLLASCSAVVVPPASIAPTGEPTAEPPERIGDGVLRIGTLFPTSGAVAFIAPPQAAGVALAVAEINAAGGVGGVPVEVLARDSGEASAATAEASFADLVTNKADVVIGPSSSALAERVIPLAKKAEITVISPAATATGLTSVDDSGYFFRTIPSYESQGHALGAILSEKGPIRVAYAYSDDVSGVAVAETLESSALAAGSEMLPFPFPPGTTDVAPIVAAVVAAKPDSVVLATSYASFDSTKALVAQLVAAGFGAGRLWLTSQNAGDYSLAIPHGTLAGVNGIIEGWNPDDAFIARLKTADSALTTFRYAAEAYDATIIAALAAMASGDDAGASVAATLSDVTRGGIKCGSFAECLDVLKTQPDIDYDGVTGPLAFTADGDISSASYGVHTYDGENRLAFTRAVLVG